MPKENYKQCNNLIKQIESYENSKELNKRLNCPYGGKCYKIINKSCLEQIANKKELFERGEKILFLKGFNATKKSFYEEFEKIGDFEDLGIMTGSFRTHKQKGNSL